MKIENNIKIEDLKTGDVLLFSKKSGSCLSKVIILLTGAKVSHAAMFYNKDDDEIIEETSSEGVVLSKAGKKFVGRMVYVRRLKEITNLDKVISVSKFYLNEEEPYDTIGLYFIGALLVYKKFTPDTVKQRIIVKILRRVIYSVVSYINDQKHPGKSPMICSQLVAQCYENAGPEYKLQFTNTKIKNIQDESVSLLDQAIALQSNVNKESSLSELLKSNNKQNEILETNDELCKKLMNAFTMKNAEENTSTPLSQELIDAISDFGHVHNLLYANNGFDTKNLTTSFAALKDMENMFVTPGDLLNNCSNLEDVGVIDMTSSKS